MKIDEILLDDERHPDDVAAQQESIAEAAARIDVFVEYWKDELKWTIQTYADADAEMLLGKLRERFWLAEPLPKRKPKL
jgi:hypothetical protein